MSLPRQPSATPPPAPAPYLTSDRPHRRPCAPLRSFCPACIYDAPHQMLLGWSRPQRYIDWAATGTGAQTFNLRPLTDDPAQAVVGARARERSIRAPRPSPPRRAGAHLAHRCPANARQPEPPPPLPHHATLTTKHSAKHRTLPLHRR